jgi:exosome complex RNA-binding protein Csl4
MARQTVNIGSAPNDGTGDPLRVAYDKLNDNFLEIYDDGGANIIVNNPVTLTETTLDVALADIEAGSGGGAVTSVNSDTGAVIVDLQSATDENNVVEYGAETTFVKYQTGADVFARILSNDDGYFEIEIQDVTGEKTRLVNGAFIKHTGGNTYSSALPDLSCTLKAQEVSVTSNTTALNFVNYTANGTITFTDPTPVTNRGYIVHVIGGTSTIGGVGYATGALVYRYYNGSSWISTDMNNTITIDATPTDGSSNAVSSNGVFDALALKQDKLFSSVNTTATSALTGTLTETIMYSVLIPANTLSSNSNLEVNLLAINSNPTAAINIRYYINTINSLSGATQVGVVSSTIRFYPFKRTFLLKPSNVFYGFNFFNNSVADTGLSSAVPSSTTYTITSDYYIIATIQLTNTADSVTGQNFSIIENK